MRTTSSATQTTWASGRYEGSARPMVRATIQRLNVNLHRTGYNKLYSTAIFGQANVPLELPNIKTVKWNRSVDGGVASMTMELYNTAPLPLGQAPQDGDLDQPGFYSPMRGNTTGSSRWSRTTNGWQDWLAPDRIIRTYEGYGFNAGVAPELDTHLYQTGVWRIDEVDFTTEGTITVSARDIGSILLDQILFPPVIPMGSYPLYFETFHQVDNPDIVTSTGGWFKPSYSSDSNVPYIGSSSMYGHHGSDAFDSSTNSYWLSIGNAEPRAPYSFEWVQGKFTSRTVQGVRVKTWGGPYVCYVSVYAGGKWQGDQTVPYDPNNPVSFPNGSNIRFSYRFRLGREDTTTFKFPKAIKGATKIRITMTSLTNSGLGVYPYRAGIRNFEVSDIVTTTRDGGTHTEPKTRPPGIGDYTDIVKTLTAWAGFYWPKDTTSAFLTYSDSSRHVQAPASNDVVLGVGRSWGDFEQTGTSPKVALGIEVWDKKPIMDGVNYVRDIVGFIFYIDDFGGCVFRSPNVWSIGNYIGDGGPNSGRTTDVVVIDERTTLMRLGAKLSSRSIRERIFVANISGHIAAMSPGHNPYPSGLRRVGGWTDQHFLTTAECQIMADLVGLRQLFTYRTDKVTIPGNPKIQVDDQVRIYERQTEETYLHYVTDVSMDFDMKTGKYTYDLGTHWLGSTTFTDWTFDPGTLSKEAQAYLKAIGKF